jgi:hypothetical protein
MVTSNETTPPGDIRPEILQKLEIAEKIIHGEYGIDFDSEFAESVITFDGPIYDENDDTLSSAERSFLQRWIEGKLGCKIDEAPIRAKYKSPDKITNVIIYDIELGDEWYLSCWQNSGEKPSYVFWHQEVYDWQLDAGYQKYE